MLLSAAMCFTIAVPALAAGDNALEQSSNNFTQAFAETSDDTIVCYMNGIGIRKDQIDNNGMINEEATQTIQNKIDQLELADSKVLKSSMSTQSAHTTATIPTGKNSAVVKTTVTAPRYSQTNVRYYFTDKLGAQFASGISATSSDAIRDILSGFIVKYGALISVMLSVYDAYKCEVADRIRERTDYGNKVQINESKSSFGTFYGVFDWNSRTILLTEDLGSMSTETLVSLQYK